jgi:hypothetical protein
LNPAFMCRKIRNAVLVSQLDHKRPSVAGSHQFVRMSEHKGEARAGYAEIKAASALHPDSGAWAFFMREVIRLPREMTPAVIQVIRLERWKVATDPLEAVRSDALEAHRRAWAKPLQGTSTTASRSDGSGLQFRIASRPPK